MLVEIEQGKVLGKAGAYPHVIAFKGIPYAAPPVGRWRWRLPRPPHPWSGVRSAYDFCDNCPQSDFDGISDFPEGLGPQAQSEDCLCLNIWMPENREGQPLPVMVWIHGGAFRAGSSAQADYDGATFAQNGVIFVSVNYRLGALGFLTHPELDAESPIGISGNYGLYDILAALGWVNRNIVQFGGDPAKITIFGQSAGAEIVSLLVASPLAHGLFQRGIVESGGAFGWRETPTIEEAEESHAKLYEYLNVNTLADLRTVCAREIMSYDKSVFAPVIDGQLIPRNLYTSLLSGAQNTIELMIGSNGDEGRPRPAVTKDVWLAEARSIYGRNADTFLNLFPARTDEEAKGAAKRAKDAEADFIAAILADTHSRTSGAQVFQYKFAHEPPALPQPHGSYHGAELPYVFGYLDRLNWPWTNVDQQLAELIPAYWINFAKTGDPNGDGLPAWPALCEPSRLVMHFEQGAEVRPRGRQSEINTFFALYYGPSGIYRQ